jgi:hypothetical protein
MYSAIFNFSTHQEIIISFTASLNFILAAFSSYFTLNGIILGKGLEYNMQQKA